MSVHEHPTKPGHWIIDCRPSGYKGKRLRHILKCTREEAIAVERSYMRRHVEYLRPTAKIISGIWPSWIAYYRANRAASTVADAETCWVHLRPVFGRLQPKVLSRQLIEQYKQARVGQGVKHRTVTKELSYLSSMLKWAAANDYCDPIPFPIAGYERRMTAPPKPRPLTVDQVGRIYETIEPAYRLVFLLMADAGLRRSEALLLHREQVEYELGVIFVMGKGSKERIVPITTDRLRHELEARRGMKGYLTINETTQRPFLSIRKALDRAAAKAGVEKHIYHHLLRHSFGTNATVASYDLSALQAIMGHSSPSTTGVYQHLAGEYLRTQGRKLNDLVTDCPEKPRPGGNVDSSSETG